MKPPTASAGLTHRDLLFASGTISEVQRGAGNELVLRVKSPSIEWRLGTEGSPWSLRSSAGSVVATDETAADAVHELLVGKSVVSVEIDELRLDLAIILDDQQRLEVVGRNQPDLETAMVPCWRLTAPSERRMLIADPLEGIIDRDPFLPAYLTWPSLLELQLRTLERHETAIGRLLLLVLVLTAVLAIAVAGAGHGWTQAVSIVSACLSAAVAVISLRYVGLRRRFDDDGPRRSALLGARGGSGSRSDVD